MGPDQVRAIEIIEPRDEDIAEVKKLFQEYADFLDADICFQNFDREMATFPAFYRRLLLAKVDGAPAAAVGYKHIDDDYCETKRLFARAEHRGLGLGKKLMETLIARARADAYQVMRLETLSRLEPALALYGALSFKKTGSYANDPTNSLIIRMERPL